MLRSTKSNGELIISLIKMFKVATKEIEDKDIVERYQQDTIAIIDTMFSGTYQQGRADGIEELLEVVDDE